MGSLKESSRESSRESTQRELREALMRALKGASIRWHSLGGGGDTPCRGLFF